MDKLVPRKLRHRLDIGVAVGEAVVEVVVDLLQLRANDLRSLEGDEDGAVVTHVSRDVFQNLLRQSKFPAVLHYHFILAVLVFLAEAVIDLSRPLRVIGDKHLIENHVIIKLDGKHILVPVDVEGQAHAACVRPTPGVEGKPLLLLGWQKEDFFAFGNGVCVNGKFIPTDDQGIVKLPGRGIFFLASNASYNRQNHKQFAFEHQFVYRDVSKITLAEFTDQFFKVFGDNARIGFAFLLATLFKDLVIRKTHSFPLLNLFGPKGSGKSDMAANLMKFFLNESKGLSLLNSSMPALGMAVGAVANALVHLEEYKNELPPNRIEFQKGMWDGIGRTKMSMDVSNRSETSAVDSGVIVSGQEMPTADIALFTRLIFLQFPRSEFTLEEKADHRKLMDMMQPGLTHLTVQILGLRDYMEKHFPSMYDQTFDLVSRRLKNDPIEDRILKNWVTVLAVYRTLEMELGINLSSQDLLNICVDGIKNQSRETKSNSELGSFWNVIQFLVSEGELVDECDYKIKNVRKFSSSKIKNAEWQENRTVLYL